MFLKSVMGECDFTWADEPSMFHAATHVLPHRGPMDLQHGPSRVRTLLCEVPCYGAIGSASLFIVTIFPTFRVSEEWKMLTRRGFFSLIW